MSNLKGTRVYSIVRTGISVAPSAILPLHTTIDLKRFNTFHVHYFTDAALEITVLWKASAVDNYTTENIVSVPATVAGKGGILSSSTKSRYLSIILTNDDVVPLTDINVSIFAKP